MFGVSKTKSDHSVALLIIIKYLLLTTTEKWVRIDNSVELNSLVLSNLTQYKCLELNSPVTDTLIVVIIYTNPRLYLNSKCNYRYAFLCSSSA